MKVSELTAQNLANYARITLGEDEYEALADGIKTEIGMALSAATAFAQNYTGLDLTTEEDEDLAYAVLVIGSEMLDNRQMTAQYTTQNPTAIGILDSHRINLLAGEGEIG